MTAQYIGDSGRYRILVGKTCQEAPDAASETPEKQARNFDTRRSAEEGLGLRYCASLRSRAYDFDCWGSGIGPIGLAFSESSLGITCREKAASRVCRAYTVGRGLVCVLCSWWKLVASESYRRTVLPDY